MRDRDGMKRHLTWQCMYVARFAVFAIVTVVVLLVAVLIEQYRMCKERGYSDCPRAGDKHVDAYSKKLSAKIERVKN
jgi:C4-dicarboxylate-specific signal transduction histidine kinase